MKKELLFNWIDIILVFIGMLGAMAVLYKGSAELSLCTLVFWVIVGVVYLIYRWNNGYGILAGLIAFGGFSWLLLTLSFDNSWLMTIFFGMLISAAGGMALWLGGVLGLLVSGIIKFILKRI